MSEVAAFPRATWFVGCGNMAGAMVRGWTGGGVNLTPVTAVRPSGQAVPGVTTVTALPEGPAPRFVMLGFKPQMLADIAPGLAARLDERTVVVSLLAGTPAAMLKTHFPGVKAIVRAMPNLPVAIRRGVTGLYSEDADEATGQLLSRLMTVLGVAVWSPNERHFGAIGALAGSGPAYVARFVDALAEAGAQRGLDPGLAQTLALETVLGTGWLAATDREPMDEIARRVSSPKGTTLAGLAVLDGELGPLLSRTIDAAVARGEEIAREANG